MSSPNPANTALIEQMRRREPEALDSIIRTHARTLYRAARGMGFREEEAEDLAQEVFTTFLETLDRFEGRSQIRTWLFGILHNKVHELRREQYRQQLNDPIDEVFESQFDAEGRWVRPPLDLDRMISAQEMNSVIQRCLEKLPAAQREAFVLREMQELETAEICKILGVTVTNMSVLIHRARSRLRECMEGRGSRRKP